MEKNVKKSVDKLNDGLFYEMSWKYPEAEHTVLYHLRSMLEDCAGVRGAMDYPMPPKPEDNIKNSILECAKALFVLDCMSQGAALAGIRLKEAILEDENNPIRPYLNFTAVASL